MQLWPSTVAASHLPAERDQYATCPTMHVKCNSRHDSATGHSLLLPRQLSAQPTESLETARAKRKSIPPSQEQPYRPLGTRCELHLRELIYQGGEPVQVEIGCYEEYLLTRDTMTCSKTQGLLPNALLKMGRSWPNACNDQSGTGSLPVVSV